MLYHDLGSTRSELVCGGRYLGDNIAMPASEVECALIRRGRCALVRRPAVGSDCIPRIIDIPGSRVARVTHGDKKGCWKF